MRTKRWVPFGHAPRVVAVLIGLTLAGCHGRESAESQLPWEPGAVPGPATGPHTGTLTISVADPEGRPLADAKVIVNDEWATTGATGVVTVGSLPERVSVGAIHDFGLYTARLVHVAQQGVTFLALTMLPGRPRPTVALLPVSIPSGSISADRSELALDVAIVSSRAAAFVPANAGTDPTGFPFVGLMLEGRSGTISMEQRHYDEPDALPPKAPPVSGSALLLLDQSERVASLDPGSRRSFAARELIRRVVGSVEPHAVSVVGLAGTSGTTTAALLPEQPIWSPLGADTAFSTDGVVLEAAVGDLEPLVGGSAPVFDGLGAALALTAARAPPGNRTVVALLGGADDGEMSDSLRASTLASLRRQRDESGIEVVLIVGAPPEQTADRRELAELSAALQAPAISLGISWTGWPFGQAWASGSYAALDLAADLIDGLALPTLSAEFRVTTGEPGAFVAGATLHGTVYVESEPCPFDCQYLPLEFAVEIP